MSTGVLFVDHQRARGEVAEDEAGVQTEDADEKPVVSMSPFGYAALDKQD